MSKFSNCSNNLLALVSLIVVLGVSASPSSVNAQNVIVSQQLGTVQLLRQDEGYITISGRNYIFDNEVTQVFLDNEEIDSAFLDEGMVVRYSFDKLDNLVRIDILGPFSKLPQLDQN